MRGSRHTRGSERKADTVSQSTVQPTPASPTPEGGHLLEVRDLHVEFRTGEGVAKVINGVSYHLDAGETLAVLGESGSGKSVTAQASTPRPP